jgi:hypothetical protein
MLGGLGPERRNPGDNAAAANSGNGHGRAVGGSITRAQQLCKLHGPQQSR